MDGENNNKKKEIIESRLHPRLAVLVFKLYEWTDRQTD